jgi:hypothetical protein
MRYKISDVFEDKLRMLYWVKVDFINDNSSEMTRVYAAASVEYLSDINRINSAQIGDKEFTDWKNNIVKKWSALGEDIFRRKIYYDSYANTNEGEANIIDFLVKLTVNINNE